MGDDAEQRFAAHLRHLRQLPFVVDAELADIGTSDPRLVLKFETGRVSLRMQVARSHLRADDITRSSSPSEGDAASRILLAPHVGAPAGDALERAGVQFMDESGNCYVRVGEHIARIQGRSPVPRSPVPRVKPLRGAGYRALFALLAQPEWVGASLRTLAQRAGVSRQAAVDAFERLDREGYTRKRGQHRAWTSKPRDRLLEQWLQGYATTVRPKLVLGRYRLPVAGPKQVDAYLEEHRGAFRFGGTAGAYRLVGHYRGPDTVIHAPFTEALRLQLRASPSDDGELVWIGSLGELGDDGPSGAAHPLLVYSELMTSLDPRAEEQALLVAEELPTWR